MNQTHRLKTDPGQFQLVRAGVKRFEIRKNDRNFEQGDRLILEETRYSAEQMAAGAPLEFTGERLNLRVMHVLYGPIYGLIDGWCIMSVRREGMIDDTGNIS